MIQRRNSLHSLNRSHKEKLSSYAPESGVRYDGVYRIEKCWRKVGIQVILSIMYMEKYYAASTCQLSSFFLGKSILMLFCFLSTGQVQGLQVSLCAL
jgi:hypothetical protein